MTYDEAIQMRNKLSETRFKVQVTQFGIYGKIINNFRSQIISTQTEKVKSIKAL